MSKSTHLFSLLVLVIVLSANIFAQSVGLLKIENQKDVEKATEILEYARGKSFDRFIVYCTDLQLALIRNSGLDIEIVADNISLEQAHMAIPSCNNKFEPTFDFNALGRWSDLGSNQRLVEILPSTANALSDQSEIRFIPLAQREIEFHFIPKATANNYFEIMSFPTDSLVSRVNIDTITAYNERLEDFYTRYIFTDSIDRARDWMVQKFLDYGYTDVTTPSFPWGGTNHYNVKAVKPGTAEPDKVIVIGGHYDAVTYSQPLPAYIYAPGSDDNGSGTTLTMEIARILADIPLRKTVIFMPFSAEEVGLVGSEDAAKDFKDAGTDIEVMFNFDMVGFTDGEPFNLDLQSGPIDVYKNLTGNSAQRVSGIIPFYPGMGGSSDHASFHDQGFTVVNCIENNFNSAGWHTELDLTSRMDFPYLTEVVKMALASILIIADSPSPVAVDGIVDIGNGSDLEVRWSDCYTDNQYIIYRGTTSGVYTDSVIVGPGACSYVWSGLNESEEQFFLVYGIAANGYRSLQAIEGSESPEVYPRAPKNVTAVSDTARIDLSWQANSEADFSHYNLYRGLAGFGVPALYQSNLSSTTFTDMSAFPGVHYDYQVTAVDFDGNESEISNVVNSIVSTFDQGFAIIDAMTMIDQYHPDEIEQQAWFDTLLNGFPYAVSRVDSSGEVAVNADMGPYSTVMWFDDDLTQKEIDLSNDQLEWYSGYQTNMMVSGFMTLQSWVSSPIPTDHLLYTDFKVTDYDFWGSPDFVGAHGQNGWPSVQIGPGRGLLEFPNIPVLNHLPGATVIYTYDSFIDYPDFEGKPVGLAINDSNGKRIILTFPIYYMTPQSAQALMAKALEFFGESFVPVTAGDLNNDSQADVADLTMMIDYLFISGQPMPYPERADFDNSCTVDIGDITIMIAYLFLSGSELTVGCS